MNYLLWSPVAFLVLLGASAAFYRLLGVLSLPSTGTGGGKLKAYACGEDVAEHRVQPDYTIQSRDLPFNQLLLEWALRMVDD